jgi:hypothetical protein
MERRISTYKSNKKEKVKKYTKKNLFSDAKNDVIRKILSQQLQIKALV